MSEWIPMLNGLSASWAEAMMRVLGAGTLVLLFVWLVCRFAPSLPAQVQSWLWRLAYLKVLLAFCWAQPLLLPVLPSSSPAPAPGAGEVPPRTAGVGMTPEPSAPVRPVLPAPRPAFSAPAARLGLMAPSPETSSEPQPEPGQGWTFQSFSMAAWVLAVLILALLHFQEWKRIRRLVRRSRPLPRNDWRKDLRELGRAQGLTKVPQLRCLRGLSSPMLVGVLLQRRLEAMKVIRPLSYPRLVLWTGVILGAACLLLVPWRLTAQEIREAEEKERRGDRERVEETEREDLGDRPKKKVRREIRRDRTLLDGGGISEEVVELEEGEGKIVVRSRVSTTTGTSQSPARGSGYARGERSQRVYQPNRTAALHPEVLRAESAALEAELALATHRHEKLVGLKKAKAVPEEEVLKARAEMERARAKMAAVQAELKAAEQIHRRQNAVTDRQRLEHAGISARAKDALIEKLQRELRELRAQMGRDQGNPPKADPFGGGAGYGSGGFGGGGGSTRQAMPHDMRKPASKEHLEREKALLKQEIELGERQLAIQQMKFEAGQISENQLLGLRREILSLKRQLIRLERGVYASPESNPFP